MKKIAPRRSVIGPPSRFGILAATALLAACVVLPEELFGYRTSYLLPGIVIISCFLGTVGYFLWVGVRIVFGKKRT